MNPAKYYKLQQHPSERLNAFLIKILTERFYNFYGTV